MSPAFGHGSVGPKAPPKGAPQGRSPYPAAVGWMALVHVPKGKQGSHSCTRARGSEAATQLTIQGRGRVYPEELSSLLNALCDHGMGSKTWHGRRYSKAPHLRGVGCIRAARGKPWGDLIPLCRAVPITASGLRG